MTEPWGVRAIPAGTRDGAEAEVWGGASATLLTGLRTVALWSTASGLERVLGTDGAVVAPPRFLLDGRPLPAGVGGRREGGSALRWVPLGGGGELVEEVTLPDTDPGVVLRWSLSPAASGHHTLTVEPAVGPAHVVELPAAGSVAVWFAPGDAPLPVPADAAAQARRRASRGDYLDGSPFALEVDAEGNGNGNGWRDRVVAAVAALDDAPLDEGPGGEPAPPFLLGVERSPLPGGRLHLGTLAGTSLAEVGLGALAAGRWSLARSVLEMLGGEASPPLPFLALAGEWGLVTGDARALRELRQALDDAVARAGGGMEGHPTSPGAAFPTLPRVLERLADAVEPAGDRGWTGSLRRSAAEAAGPASRQLPVLGATPTPGTGLKPRDAILPPAGSFAHTDDPGVLGRRTLHGARWIRALVRGTLGLTPDAAYGRIRVAPVLPSEWRAAGAREIRVGDARLDLGYRGEGARHTFVLRPTAGRAPVTVILEPLLPLEEVERVELEGERVTVDSFRGEGRVGVRFQFPLDGDRTVTVVGRPSEGGDS